MSELKKISLKDFQLQVQSKYRNLKGFLKVEKEIQKDNREKRFPYLFLPVYMLAGFLVKIQKKRRKNSKVEENAEYLLSQKALKVTICSEFEPLARKEILTEEKFVDSITKALWGMVRQKKIEIADDAYLYAEIAHRIYEAGLEEYCGIPEKTASKQ